MREIRSYGSVGERGGNEPLYPEIEQARTGATNVFVYIGQSSFISSSRIPHSLHDGSMNYFQMRWQVSPSGSFGQSFGIAGALHFDFG